MPIEVVRAADAALDSWKGMAEFSKTQEFVTVGVSREEYEENGGERIRKWWGGNSNGGLLP
jgi:actin-related protein 5